MVVEVNGTNTGYYYLYCSDSSTCYIDCQSTYACSGLILDCKTNNCYVYCNEDNDIECPLYGDYSYYSGSNAVTTINTTTTPNARNSNNNKSNDQTLYIILVICGTIIGIIFLCLCTWGVVRCFSIYLDSKSVSASSNNINGNSNDAETMSTIVQLNKLRALNISSANERKKENNVVLVHDLGGNSKIANNNKNYSNDDDNDVEELFDQIQEGGATPM